MIYKNLQNKAYKNNYRPLRAKLSNFFVFVGGRVQDVLAARPPSFQNHFFNLCEGSFNLSFSISHFGKKSSSHNRIGSSKCTVSLCRLIIVFRSTNTPFDESQFRPIANRPKFETAFCRCH